MPARQDIGTFVGPPFRNYPLSFRHLDEATDWWSSRCRSRLPCARTTFVGLPFPTNRLRSGHCFLSLSASPLRSGILSAGGCCEASWGRYSAAGPAKSKTCVDAILNGDRPVRTSALTDRSRGSHGRPRLAARATSCRNSGNGTEPARPRVRGGAIPVPPTSIGSLRAGSASLVPGFPIPFGESRNRPKLLRFRGVRNYPPRRSIREIRSWGCRSASRQRLRSLATASERANWRKPQSHRRYGSGLENGSSLRCPRVFVGLRFPTKRLKKLDIPGNGRGCRRGLLNRRREIRGAVIPIQASAWTGFS